MYGTVMIGKLRASAADVVRELGDWEAQRRVPGYMDSRVMFAEDGRVAMVVRFQSKEDYLRLAGDPGQDEWYRGHVAPLLEGDPEWIDGEWLR
jgi:hypothetical protein